MGPLVLPETVRSLAPRRRRPALEAVERIPARRQPRLLRCDPFGLLRGDRLVPALGKARIAPPPRIDGPRRPPDLNRRRLRLSGDPQRLQKRPLGIRRPRRRWLRRLGMMPIAHDSPLRSKRSDSAIACRGV